VDEKVVNLLLERFNRLEAGMQRMGAELGARMEALDGRMVTLERKLDDLREANDTAVGWAGFAFANHETLVRRLDDFARRIGRLEQGAQ
jgi:hypothetical protein